MRYLTPKETKDNLVHQFSIFRDKHNWVVTWLYTLTYGSFIGYANAVPKLIVSEGSTEMTVGGTPGSFT